MVAVTVDLWTDFKVLKCNFRSNINPVRADGTRSRKPCLDNDPSGCTDWNDAWAGRELET